MQKRAIRRTLFALLLLAGIGASYVIWDIQQRLDILFDSGRDLEARLDRVTAAVAALGGAQQAYVAPGQIDDPWFSRVTSLVRELTDESAALGRHSHSPGASTKLRMFPPIGAPGAAAATITPAPAPVARAVNTSAEPAVHLSEAAAVCTAISRITDARALPDVLARAATVIDAAGIVVWLSAGEELFAVAAHGYSA